MPLPDDVEAVGHLKNICSLFREFFNHYPGYFFISTRAGSRHFWKQKLMR